MPTVAKSCQKFPKVAKSWQKAAKSSQQLQKHNLGTNEHMDEHTDEGKKYH